MRIADKMGYDQVKSNLNKNRSDMSNLQNQAATMKKLTRPSDDPVATTRTLSVKTDRHVAEQFIKNVDLAKNFIEASEQALGDVNDTLVRAKELAISQANDASANALTRQSVAIEIEQLLKHVTGIANRKLGDRFVFGGYKTTAAPFTMKGEYSGDDGEIQIEINKGVYVPVNLSGDKVFLGKGFVFSPSTQKQAEAQAEDAEGKTPPTPQAPQESVSSRGPASIDSQPQYQTIDVKGQTKASDPDKGQQVGVNIFNVLKKLEIGLRTNDKEAIQQSLDNLDEAINQVIVARSRLGARVMTIDNTSEALRKGTVEQKTLESKFEDADAYELFTDINKSQTTLQASLSTSGRLIQPSLLDFLK
ncbi:MAG TPA: flagellar hook-associated protein FlgL [Bdellovibrionales bacterium]|nr:flagellar hook-associated protein FlgL [Bdellovibrionales bacterium]